MPNPRAAALVLGLLVLLGGLVAGAWHLFSRDDAEAAGRDPGGPVATTDTVETGLVTPADVSSGRAPEMVRPWPFAQYMDVINRLRSAAPDANAMERRDQKIHEMGERFAEHRFDIRMSGATANEVIERIASELVPVDVKVFTTEPHLPDAFRFEIDMRQTTASDVVNEMRSQCRDRVKFRILPEGLVIGTDRALMRATSESKREDVRRAAQEAADSPLRAGTYRPDFENAHIGDVARDIEAQTGVTMVVGPELWRRAERITWRGKDTSLRSVLNRITDLTDSVWRVEDGRVFLIAP